MTRQPALLERPGTDHAPATPVIPLPRAAVDLLPRATTATEVPAPAASEVPEDAAPATRRSLPRPPGRRGPLWLAALVVGAVVAALPTTMGDQATGVAVSAAEYGLGVASDVGLTGDMEDAGVRRGITEAEAQARLGELAASRAARAPRTVLPTQGRLTTCFCQRWGTMHYGLDLAAPLGTPILTATDGVVIRAGRASGYGNAVYIQDADGNVHVYGHMRYYSVSAGDLVHAGDQIAKVGNEGQSTGPHLHYEIHRGGMTGRPIDPQEFLAERGVSV
ncbi:M23 family metallopeptidase [Geodermatophilus sabuli]|uniref:Peptidase family M23 n=1 Tax=Geodermatophilus sabuli TaxID=1564158 RepID=A0A285E9E2_9ACTN|nr:M23 family metallopeptidase [Geodermatophilus sabuli]MBB3084853.1 murein DD-endopeptidase MepM/ murein hydrolase activator NlpD [Geodermatophilus sabuli]SNX95739.1 Peptidase family M23 [Geodermatophilus sabuli]